MPSGRAESVRLCNSARCGLSRSLCGSKIGIEPPFRLLISFPCLPPPNKDYSLGKIHNLKALGTHHRQFMLQEMHIQRFGRDKEVLVQPEPLCTLSEDIPKGSSLLSLFPLGIAPVHDGLQHPKERVHALFLHVQDQGPAGQLTDGEEHDIFAGR